MKDQYDKQKENLRMQKELLSYLLNDPSLYYRCIDTINCDMFTGIYRQLFDAFIRSITENKKPDVLTISEKANIPMDEAIDVFTYFSGAPIPLDALIYQLFDDMARGKLSSLAGFISMQVQAGTDYETITEHIAKSLKDLQLGNSASIITMDAAVTDLMRNIVNNAKAEQKFAGIPTGYKIIDYHMGGFHPGDLVILAGETSHGKTSFALSCMYGTSVLYNMPTGIISHEMTPQQLTGRLAAYATDISSKHLLFGKLQSYEYEQFNQKVQGLIKANIYIQDFIKRELIDTIAAIRLMVMQYNVRYVVVENAGNINVKGIRDDEPRTAEISKAMKSIAMELNITVMLISHLNREQGGKKGQPTLSRLRHSGQLENDADVVMFVYRAELHGYERFQDPSDESDISTEGMAKVYIAKGRNVGLAQTYMRFNEQLTYFSDDQTGTGSPF